MVIHKIKKEVGSYMLYVGDTRVTIYFCVHCVICAYILEVHMIIVFNVFSHFLDRKVI